MEDHNVQLSPPMALITALDDISQGEVFDSLNFCWYFCVGSMFYSESCMFGFSVIFLFFASIFL